MTEGWIIKETLCGGKVCGFMGGGVQERLREPGESRQNRLLYEKASSYREEREREDRGLSG